MKVKIIWPADEDSGWIYFDAADEVRHEFVMERLNTHFSDSQLYLSCTRQNSFDVKKENILNETKGF